MVGQAFVPVQKRDPEVTARATAVAPRRQGRLRYQSALALAFDDKFLYKYMALRGTEAMALPR